MTAVQTIATATPSVAPPRLLIHYVPKNRDGSNGSRALCGHEWDRIDVPGGRRCPECAPVKAHVCCLCARSEEGAVRRLHALSRLVRQKGDTADRRALLKQAWQDLSRRCVSTPSAEELAAWVGVP